MTTTKLNNCHCPESSAAAPYFDAPKARDYVLKLGRIYLDAGLPLASALEAALADYQSFGVPFACEG